MKNKLLIFIVFVSLGTGFFLGGYFFKGLQTTNLATLKSPLTKPLPTPLAKYTIENLSQAEIGPGKLTLEKIIKEEEKFCSWLFFFEFSPDLSGKNFKRVSGLINLPQQAGTYPVILMLRGYVDQKIYQTGMGTSRAGEYFSQNGFITIAPDFLGYGESDKEAENIFEARFQSYVTVLSLLKQLKSSKGIQIKNDKWHGENIMLWGHSNGGQIALTILEITQEALPTTLWAPVSKPFPYSILYYTDESEDRGKLIRKELAKFEEVYDVDNYSLTNYFDKINKETLLQIHQGTADDAVPVTWTNALVKTLKGLDLNLNFFLYPGADHNLKPAWDLVVKRDLDFFKKN